MTMPPDDHMSEADGLVARRVEVFTGAGRGREWTAEQKAAIVAESYGSASVCDVARRHGLTPTQLFTWRRTARQMTAATVADASPEFVAAVIETPEVGSRKEQPADAAPLIGFMLEGASVWVCAGVDTGVLTAIIRALKASK